MKFAATAFTLACAAGAAVAQTARFTAIGARNGVSTVECWTLKDGFADQNGLKVLTIGASTGATYLEAPKDTEYSQGPYNPARPQYFVILNGEATITFPGSTEVLHARAQELYFAADTADISTQGHITKVSKGARMIQLPFPNGAPAHTATLGACS